MGPYRQAPEIKSYSVTHICELNIGPYKNMSSTTIGIKAMSEEEAVDKHRKGLEANGSIVLSLDNVHEMKTYSDSKNESV